jgi:LysM repeat protein
MRKVRIFFRLALVLCIVVFALKPVFKKKPQEKPPAYGLGGGTLPEIIINSEEPVFENVILEPESFSRPRILVYDAYTVKKGDMIGKLAVEFGLNQDTLISVNAIKNTRLLQEKQILKIPNQDGILYPVQSGDTLFSIAEKNKSDPQAIQIANELFSENVKAGTALFIPGGRLDYANLQEINGDLFLWPVFGSITSPYGYRSDPFTGSRLFHSGLDISARMGSPVRAAMAGRVNTVAYDDIRGNYVVISHHSGYRTLYGHMSVIRTKVGAYVGTLEQIGDVGSTGQSTGPHVHFTVFKDGVTVNPRVLMK